MKSALAGVLLIAAVAVGTCISAEDLYPYKQRRETVSTLFYALYNEVGARIRFSAIIDACGNKELSNQLYPSERELAELLIKKIQKIYLGESSEAAYLQKLSTQEVMDLVDAVATHAAFYRVGFMEASKTFIGSNPSFCRDAMTEANKLLKSE